jgi:hypothetical protein
MLPGFPTLPALRQCRGLMSGAWRKVVMVNFCVVLFAFHGAHLQSAHQSSSIPSAVSPVFPASIIDTSSRRQCQTLSSRLPSSAGHTHTPSGIWHLHYTKYTIGPDLDRFPYGIPCRWGLATCVCCFSIALTACPGRCRTGRSQQRARSGA